MKTKASDRTTTKNLYIPRGYGGLSTEIEKSAKLINAQISGKSYHAIIWLAAFIGMAQISNMEFENLKELENQIGENVTGEL
jgi:hypothetical protein